MRDVTDIDSWVVILIFVVCDEYMLSAFNMLRRNVSFIFKPIKHHFADNQDVKLTFVWKAQVNHCLTSIWNYPVSLFLTELWKRKLQFCCSLCYVVVVVVVVTPACAVRFWSTRGSALHAHNVLAESRFALAIHMMPGDWQQLQSTHFVCKSCTKTSKENNMNSIFFHTFWAEPIWTHTFSHLANWHLHHQPLWCTTCCGICHNAYQCSPLSAL